MHNLNFVRLDSFRDFYPRLLLFNDYGRGVLCISLLGVLKWIVLFQGESLPLLWSIQLVRFWFRVLGSEFRFCCCYFSFNFILFQNNLVNWFGVAHRCGTFLGSSLKSTSWSAANFWRCIFTISDRHHVLTCAKRTSDLAISSVGCCLCPYSSCLWTIASVQTLASPRSHSWQTHPLCRLTSSDFCHQGWALA